jgi:hypothetical protein
MLYFLDEVVEPLNDGSTTKIAIIVTAVIVIVAAIVITLLIKGKKK